MGIENSTLYNEVQSVFNSGDKDAFYYWECQLHAGGKTHIPYKLISIDTVRNFVASYSDYIVLEIAMGGGTFAHEVAPFKEDLTVTLIKTPIGMIQTSPDLEKGITSQTFRATLIKADLDLSSGNSTEMGNKETADLISIRQVRFQLQDMALEQLRMASTGTIFRAKTGEQIIMALLTKMSQALNVDADNQIPGVTMVKAHNQEPREHIPIPQGMPLVDVPDYIQNKAGGIYSTGFSYYLQKGFWYVWPTYDLSRFDTSPKTITIILLPDNRFTEVERTYRVTANQVIILITGGTQHVDDSESKILNEGNGVRFADSRKLMDGFSTSGDNKAVAQRTYNATEVTAIPRVNKLNMVATRKPTDNSFAEMSRLASRNGSIMTCLWENSDIDLIRPGVPVQVMYTKDDLPIVLKACILNLHTFTFDATPGMDNRRHVSKTAMTLFVEKDLPELLEYKSTNPVDRYTTPSSI